MAGKTKVYDPASVLCVFAGIPLSGFAEDTVVSVEYNEDAFTLKMGVDGDGTRAKSNNRSATITFHLMQSSDINDLLSAVHLLDLNSPSGDGIGPLLIKDNNGRTLMLAEQAWIKKTPSVEFAKEPGPREWVLETANLEPFIGGN